MTFPENLDDRAKYIEERVLAGEFDFTWVELVHEEDGRVLKLFVMEDALKIDGVRVNVSARSEQRLADMFDASLPTAKVADMMYAHAVRKILPSPTSISSTVSAMKAHSERIDSMLLQGESSGLLSPVGKHWILDKSLREGKTTACNYGWHFRGTTFKGIRGYRPVSNVCDYDVSVIQQNATAHDSAHSDYSQTCQLVCQTCWVDGETKRFSDILRDPNLAKLVSHTGPLSIDRQPGVQREVGKIVLPPLVVTGG